MSSEIELKFRIPAARLGAVRRAVATRSAVLEPLAAVYFDTPGEHLARARVALRLRLEASGWVQTLKAEGATAMQRLEHNVLLPDAGPQRPALDLARHDGSPAGAVLARVLADARADARKEARTKAPAEALAEAPAEAPTPLGGGASPSASAAALTERYATEVQRTRRLLRHGGALIELALDEGHISAGAAGNVDAAVCSVCEIEFELLRGPPQALLDLAGRWVDRFGLVLDLRSKSERGHRLALGHQASPPGHARPLKLSRQASSAQALAAMLANALGQVLANASQMADGHSQPEHLHQLRVGLRRLRSVLHVFAPVAAPADASLAPRLSALFTQLGAARDQDAMAEWLWPALQAAGAPEFVRRAGLPAGLPADLTAALTTDLTTLLRAPATQRLWLALLGACQPVEGAVPDPTAAPLPSLRQQLRKPLRRLYRQVQRDAARFDALDDAARHRLRRRIKRLRYATELSAALWPAKAVAQLLRGLARAQAPLGEFNDTVVAQAHCQALAAHDARAWFAVGWLSARRQALAPVCALALARLAKRPGCWPRG